MTTQNLTLLNAMVQKMDWLEERQKVIAQNIANADTPGYRPNDVTPIDFKSILGKATQTPSLASGLSGIGAGAASSATSGLALTNAAHLNVGGTSTGGTKSQERQEKHPYEVAPAGNAVVLEEQLLKMNETYTDHRFITNLYQKNIDMLKTAIRSQ
ncbi:MAG: flagellar basal body rod protein FlgB [Alphaproteobacteria bacterium]|nr:flagellar basal body rod protein FlgB [Alphaproteobacteria bacterium]